uniref:Testis expressed 53 n=1 Tax=Propithecus coquereli TaxID=379532 RepID=A0A2K6GK10_PROCO
MVAKIFCCCCKADEGPPTTVGSRNPRMSQQQHPRSLSLNKNSHRNSMPRKRPGLPADNRAMLKVFNLGRPS